MLRILGEGGVECRSRLVFLGIGRNVGSMGVTIYKALCRQGSGFECKFLLDSICILPLVRLTGVLVFVVSRLGMSRSSSLHLSSMDLSHKLRMLLLLFLSSLSIDLRMSRTHHQVLVEVVSRPWLVCVGVCHGLVPVVVAHFVDWKEKVF